MNPRLLELLVAGLTLSIVSMAVGLLTLVVLARGQWCDVAWRRYARKAAGLPMLRTRHLLANHLRYLVYGQDNCLLVRDAHKELGKTFGWMNGTQRAASTIDLDLIKTLIEDEKIHMDRAPSPPIVTPIETGRGIMWARGDKWRKLRGVFAPIVSDRTNISDPNLLKSVDNSIAKLESLIEHHLGSNSQTLIAIDDLIHRFTLDVLFACFYGENDQVNYDHDPSHWVKHVNKAAASSSQDLKLKISIIFPWASVFGLFDSLTRWLRLRDWAGNLISELISNHIKQRLKFKKQFGDVQDKSKNHQNPLVASLVDTHLSGKLSWREYADCLSSLVGTADTTTKSCLVNTLYLLATHESEQNKLRESLARTNQNDCDYLSWVLNESLRLVPPVPFGVARTTGRDVRLKNGHIVPAGTLVSVSAFALHRSEEHWGLDAAEFKPERWLNADKLHPYQFLPFGAGHRQCPGREFAMLEMKMLLSSLLKRYKFEAKVKPDVQKLTSPFQHYSVANSPTYITIRRV